MLSFILMSVGIFIVVTVAVEWLLDLLSKYSNHRGFTYEGRQATPAAIRALHRAEFDAICDDLVWEQLVIARGWPVSAQLAKRAFQVAVTATAVTRGPALENAKGRQVRSSSDNP